MSTTAPHTHIKNHTGVLYASHTPARSLYTHKRHTLWVSILASPSGVTGLRGKPQNHFQTQTAQGARRIRHFESSVQCNKEFSGRKTGAYRTSTLVLSPASHPRWLSLLLFELCVCTAIANSQSYYPGGPHSLDTVSREPGSLIIHPRVLQI